MTKKILCIIAIALISNVSAQVYVNKVYQERTGNPVFNPILNSFGIQWSKSITNSVNELITVGHTNVSGQGENIFLNKTDADGNVVFQINWNSGSTNNDYGIDLTLDGSGNIYVCGTTDNGGNTNYDAIILKFNSTGTLLNSTIFSGPDGKNDIATSIKWDNSNGIYVAATNENNSTSYDYLLLKYSTGMSFIYSNTYDYNGLLEVPLGIEVAGSDIFIIGTSASNSIDWDYTTAKFMAGSGVFISDERNSLSSVGLDQPLAVTMDTAGNIYLTGKAFNTSGNFDVLTVKINSAFTVDWSQVLDGYGYDDAGNSIVVDASGNVVVGGLFTKSNGKTEFICIKYNGSTGTQMWILNKESESNNGNAFAKALTIKGATGDIFYTGGELSLSGFKQVMVGKISSGGNYVWERKINQTNTDLIPSDITSVSDGVCVIAVLDSVLKSYTLTKYTDFELDTARGFASGGIWKKRELIVSFLPSAVNKNKIDNNSGTAESEYGDLSDFLNSSAYTQVNNALSELCGGDCQINVVKVYDELKTSDTLAESALGLPVKIPAFWSTLLLELPSNVDIFQAQPVLKSLTSVVSFAHPNYFIGLANTAPNDSMYASDQVNLHYSPFTPGADINVEEAWSVIQNCGSPFIKGGVFDTGINWKHKDFGYTGSPTSGKIQGWSLPLYNSNTFANGGLGVNIRSLILPSAADPGGHGTSVAGIIGAIRNNGIGVAGIAGGDAANGNPGVSLYSLNTANTTILHTLKALLETSRTGSLPYNYGLNFSNHSYFLFIGGSAYTPDSLASYNKTLHFINRMQETFIAARGNDGTSNISYPACFDPAWVISVGGTGSTGQWKGSIVEDNIPIPWLPSYGMGIDICAPSIKALVQSTWNNGGYNSASGTSGAAPHVSGVVGLLQSYMNNPNGNPDYMNLAPEDCESIITKSATDINIPGYDSLTGWGRLNAGKALRLVEKPFQTLIHYGTNSRYPYTLSKSLIGISDTIILTEEYENYETPKKIFTPAKYVVNTYQIDASVNQIYTYPTDSIMYFWPRHSSSFVYTLPNSQKRINLHERVEIVSIGASSAQLRGYIYKVWDTNGNFKGWWPCDTSFTSLYSGIGSPKTLMEYSVLSKNKAVGISEYNKDKFSISLFPNPANKSHTLTFDSDNDGNCTVELYDISGKYLKTVYKDRIQRGKVNVTNNIESLPNSMYIYIVKLDGRTLNKKFIKD